MNLGIVRIKNVSGAEYEVVELGGFILADQEEVDLLDATLATHYDEYHAAFQLVTALSTAQLYQDIQAGKVALLETTPPPGV
jgi:hypothetical protein